MAGKDTSLFISLITTRITLRGILKETRRCSGIFIINFEIILQLLPEFQLLPSNMKMFAEMKINQPVRNTCFLSS